MSGSLILIQGPMFSGKTLGLFKYFEQNMLGGIPSVFIKYAKDTRYDRKSLVCSHNGQKAGAISAESLLVDPPGLPENVKVICIDEGQFFEGLRAFCERWNARGVDIYVAALNGDKDQCSWPRITDIMPLCTKIKLTYAVCIVCQNKKATCTKALVEVINSDKILIGSDESFAATCRTCLKTEITPEMLKRRQETLEMIKNI